MDFQIAFKNVARLNDETSQCLIELSSITPQTCSYRQLLRYCKIWCCLADFLFTNQIDKLPVSLNFVMGNTKTDCYWLNLLYYSNRLARDLMATLVQAYDAQYRIDNNTFVSQSIPVQVGEQTTLQMIDVIGISHYCKTVLMKNCVWYEELMPEETHESRQLYHCLRIVACWIRAGAMQRTPPSERDWEKISSIYYTICQIAERNHLSSYPIIEAILKDCEIQMLVNKAEYHMECTVDYGIISASLKEAHKLGWKLTIRQEEAIDDNDNVFRHSEPTRTELETYPPTLQYVDIFVRGVDPLLTAVFERL